MTQEYTDSALHTQLKCLEALFDVGRLQAKKKWGDKVYVCLLACLLGCSACVVGGFIVYVVFFACAVPVAFVFVLLRLFGLLYFCYNVNL
jgi:hypothetical protein